MCPPLSGDSAMLADIQTSLVSAQPAQLGPLTGHPEIKTDRAALRQKLGHITATQAAGPMAPPALNRRKSIQ